MQEDKNVKYKKNQKKKTKNNTISQKILLFNNKE